MKDDTKDIKTITTAAPGLVGYRKKMREAIIGGKIPRDTSYTFRRLVWLAGTAKYSNDKYGFYDKKRNFGDQQFDTTFKTVTGQLSLNWYSGWDHKLYRWKKYRPVFLYGSLYINWSKSNNISDLKKIDVQDIKSTAFDSAANITRQTVKSGSYYQGKYYDYATTTVGAKFYFSPFNHFTLNLLAERNFITNARDNPVKDYAVLGIGGYIYTGQDDNLKLNLGVLFKRVQSSVDQTWEDKVELVTSIPINPN